MAETTQGDLLEDLLPPPPAAHVHRVPVVAHTRAVKGHAKPDGLQRRDRAHAAHEKDADRARALEYVRGELRALYERKRRMYYDTPADIYVTSDDAFAILQRWAEMPPALRAAKTQAWMGAIFRAPGWAKIPNRMVKSDPVLRPSNHGAVIACWRVVD